jgi:hypothetical protein
VQGTRHNEVDEGARRASKRAHAPRLRPWEDPLPALRISPKLSIDDIIGKAQVRYELDHPGLKLAKMATVHRGHKVRRSPERALNLHAGFKVSGAVSGGSKFKLQPICGPSPGPKRIG